MFENYFFNLSGFIMLYTLYHYFVAKNDTMYDTVWYSYDAVYTVEIVFSDAFSLDQCNGMNFFQLMQHTS